MPQNQDMGTKFYRIVTSEVFNRIPKDGLHGLPEAQRFSLSGEFVIVQRAEGYAVNDRWLTHENALSLIKNSEWDEQDIE